MLKWKETTALLGLALVGGVILVWIGCKHGADSEAMAGWVQAIGSIAAILLVTLPVIVERRLERVQSRQLCLAAATMAYGTMTDVADRNVNPDYVGSEWWMPQWDILDKALADCPIHKTGSAEALIAFVSFQQLFAQAKAFDDQTETAHGFIIAVTMNAATALEDLRKALGVREPAEPKRRGRSPTVK